MYYQETLVVWKQTVLKESTRLKMGNDQKREVKNWRLEKIETVTDQTNESMVSNLDVPQNILEV